MIYAYADGPRSTADVNMVAEVREMLAAVNWCRMNVVERRLNMGLGRNVLSAVAEVASKHPAFIVWEDDLICVPGTYDWICAALRRYSVEEKVFSVSAWNHPRVTPPDVASAPYFDGRAECWVWGGYSRSWVGMEETAMEKMSALDSRLVMAYGADLPQMARAESVRNLWAVRWLYHHLQHGGLCLRPPWSMVEHIGFDDSATNAAGASMWKNPTLKEAPPIPVEWPEVREHPACRRLWRGATGGRLDRIRQFLTTFLRSH